VQYRSSSFSLEMSEKSLLAAGAEASPLCVLLLDVIE